MFSASYLVPLGATLALAACSLDFDTSRIPGARPGTDAASSNKMDAGAAAGFAPIALWWFADEGMPGKVPDRAKKGLGVDLFPVLSSDVGRGRVEQGVWITDKGELRSDPIPATKLAAAIAESQAITLEAWTEVDVDMGGKGTVIACEFAGILQTVIGTESFLNLKNGSIDNPVSLLPPTRLRHVVATYAASSGIARLYLDGDQVASADKRDPGASDNSISVPNDEIRISLGRSWSGKMHLAAIYDRALTPEQIRAVFAQGSMRR